MKAKINYWRMQLHPNKGKRAMYYASQSIAAGFIGLDFALTEDGKVVGDLLSDNDQKIPPKQNGYVDFAKKMDIGDKVLIMVHHFPFAVVTVDGDYNYIRETEPELGVWFRHFRRIKDIIYFSDYKYTPDSSDGIVMTNTISILNDPDSESYRLIEKMLTFKSDDVVDGESSNGS